VKAAVAGAIRAAITILLLAIPAGAQLTDSTGKPVTLRELKQAYQRPASIPFPADNTWTPEREALGRALFFDPRLSASSVISCASCHNPSFSWGDGLAKGVGHRHRPAERRTPTILNVAWADLLFWDGRAPDLESQAMAPIEAPGEMNMPVEDLLPKLTEIRGYRSMFEQAYPGEGITKVTVAKAIATFQRTVVSGVAPFDEWINGRENAISESAKRGFVLFNGTARCAICHSGWNFTDGSFHDIGVPSPDRGRGRVLPQIVRMQHAFKVPTLRNVDHRGPYMHNGSVATLADVIDLYETGGVARPSRSAEIRALRLSPGDKADLVEFLKTLTSVDPAMALPVLPR
jgi:cytochrome c peroxidase